jgi:sigma-E factor negative regulatory protein RseC
MDKEKALVIKVLDDGKVIVEMELDTSCSTCASKSSCIVHGNVLRQVTAIDSIGVIKGQIVNLKHNPTEKVKAAVVLFLIPVLFLIAGFFLGSNLAVKAGREASSESWGILSGIVFIALSFIIVRQVNRNFERHKKHLPIIVEKIANNPN